MLINLTKASYIFHTETKQSDILSERITNDASDLENRMDLGSTYHSRFGTTHHSVTLYIFTIDGNSSQLLLGVINWRCQITLDIRIVLYA